MPRREHELNLAAALWAVQALSRLLATAGVLLGLNVILRPGWDGNEIYRTALQVPGAPPTWGWVVLIIAANIGLGQWLRKPRCVAFGHFAASVWAMFFALSILKTFWDTPTIPTGGIIVYFTLAVTHLVIGAVYFGSRK
jgi:hypothetical protein